MIEARKADHLRICAEMDVEFAKTTLLEDVQLVHRAMSTHSLDAIDTTAQFMGRKLRAPLIISAMSGGTAGAEELNRDLARAAQATGLGFCLGSQRPMLEKPSLRTSYAVRKYAPDVPIVGNLGLQQAAVADPKAVLALVSSIEADGLAIHLNPAHEIRQEEGDRSFPSGIRALQTFARRLARQADGQRDWLWDFPAGRHRTEKGRRSRARYRRRRRHVLAAGGESSARRPRLATHLARRMGHPHRGLDPAGARLGI